MIKGHQTVFINFADQGFEKAQHLSTWSAKKLGKFDRVIEYAPSDIDRNFFDANRCILEIKRGAGEWLWKPYFILKTLEEMDTGDFLFYCDSGALILRSCKFLFEPMDASDLWVSDIPLIERQWTKQSVINALGISNREDVLNSNQIQGGFIGVKKSPQSVRFIREWLRLCCESDLLLPDAENKKTGDCISHREDQSSLSILCKLRGIDPHRDPTQYGRIPEKYKGIGAVFSVPDHEEDNYPVLILLHRTGNCNWSVILKQWMNIVLPKKLVRRLIR